MEPCQITINEPKILAFAGSTRTGSFNKKLVKVAAAGASLNMLFFGILIYDNKIYPNFAVSIFLAVMSLTQLIQSLQPLQDLLERGKVAPNLQQV